MSIAIVKKVHLTFLKLHLRLIPQQSILLGFLGYIILGVVCLSLPWAQQKSVSFLDNVFTATSALSTTGLTTVSIADSYSVFGQVIILLLIQLGGIGYMTLTSYLLIATSRQLTHWHLKLMKTEFSMPSYFDMKDFLKAMIIFTVVMEAVGTLLFFIGFKADGFASLHALWLSVFHSISSFCTAGFSLFNNSFMHYSGNLYMNIVVTVLSVTGALGFIMVTDCYNFLRRKVKRLTFTSIVLFVVMFLLVLAGSFVYFFKETSLQSLGVEHKWLASVFQSMSALTTVGFNSVDVSVLSQPVVLITIFLMYIGASPSSTAGGLKITTLTAIIAVVKSKLQGKTEVTLANRKIPKLRTDMALITFTGYTAVLFFATFLLSFSENVGFNKLLFEVTSAIGTVGLSMGVTSILSAFGKWVLIVVMFIGRVGVITFAMALLSRKKEKQCKTEDDLVV